MKKICLICILLLVSFSLCSCVKEVKYVDYDYDIVYPTTVTISSFSGNGRYRFHFIDCKNFEYEVYATIGSLDENKKDLKMISVNSNEEFAWYAVSENVSSMYDYDLGDCYLKFIVKNEDEIKGLFIIKLIRLEHSVHLMYYAHMVKSVIFDEPITIEKIDELYNKFIEEDTSLEKEYNIKLQYSDNNDVIELPSTGKPKDIITFCAAYDGIISYEIYINGVRKNWYYHDQELVKEIDGKKYYEYSFRMPAADVTVSLRKSERIGDYFLIPDRYLNTLSYDLQEEIVSKYFRENDAEKMIPQIHRYYGTYNNAIVVEIDGKVKNQYTENINNEEYSYEGYSCIYAYYEGELYSLTEAYNKNILTMEEIKEIKFKGEVYE